MHEIASPADEATAPLLRVAFALSILAIALWPVPVPHGDETLYLLLPYHFWDADFLSNDWTFSQPWPSQWAFSVLNAPGTLLPIEWLGWIGRIAVAASACWLLLQIGQALGGTTWSVAAGTALWLLCGQSLIPGDWIMKWYTAKGVSYVMVLSGVLFSLNGRIWFAAIAMGLAAALHPIVGLWCGLATVTGWVCSDRSIGRPMAASLLMAVVAAPVFLGEVLLVAAPRANDELAFMLDEWCGHCGPESFPQRDLLAVVLHGVVAIIFYARFWNGSSRHRFVFGFLVTLFAAFLIGWSAGLLEIRAVQALLPMRVFPVFCLLFFCWVLSSLLEGDHARRLSKTWLVVTLIAAAMLPNPIGRSADAVAAAVDAWVIRDGYDEAFRWIREQAPADAVLISPPWRGDSWSASRRAQVAVFQSPPLVGVDQWRERIGRLTGGDFGPANRSWADRMRNGFLNLTQNDILEIQARYGASHLVSQSVYDFPVLFDSQSVRVYELLAPSTVAGDSGHETNRH